MYTWGTLCVPCGLINEPPDRRGIRLALRLYLLGLILFLVSLLAPAFSPFGAVDYNGAQALRAVLALRPRLLLDLGRSADQISLILLAGAALNSVFALLSPLLFAYRRRFQRRRVFWLGAGTGLLLMLLLSARLLTGGYLQLRYGYYCWLLSIALIYISFLPSLRR